MSQEQIMSIWTPITFSEKWETSNTSRIDAILPSWSRKRESLKTTPKEFEDFIGRQKRQHAIETGIIERLYDLREGVTETFVKEWFVDSYLQHGDTNIPADKLMAYLNDNFEAIDFVFTFVKDERRLTISFIKELHQLITRHQESTDAVDQHGNYFKKRLLKWEFKQDENNPRRSDGTIFRYCPPIQVASEMENLLGIYEDISSRRVHPIIIAAWLHHAFTQIHPFQDWNGRLARLLASLVLIKHDLFALTIKRDDKKRYIDALELADHGNPQYLVDLFCDIQKGNIELALNLGYDSSGRSLKEVSDILTSKLKAKKQDTEMKRGEKLDVNRTSIFSMCVNFIDEEIAHLRPQLSSGGLGEIAVRPSGPADDIRQHYYTHQIIEYANQQNPAYYFNKNLPRAYIKVNFDLFDRKRYQLIITMHHYGYDDTTWAIGAFMEFDESSTKADESFKESIVLPLNIAPFTVSLENDPENILKSERDIRSFIQNSLTVAIAQIASEQW